MRTDIILGGMVAIIMAVAFSVFFGAMLGVTQCKYDILISYYNPAFRLGCELTKERKDLGK